MQKSVFKQQTLIRALVAGVMLSTVPTGASWAESAKPAKAKALKASANPALDNAIRDYLLKNPEVIRDAMMALEAKEQQAKAEEARKALTAQADKLLNDPASPVGGNPKGDVTVVEFFDYRCGYCRKVSPTVATLIESDPNVRVVYKEFPILGPESLVASRAALAANLQGKYAEFHKGLMASDDINDALIMKLATDTGLDLARFNTDRESAQISAALDATYALAGALNINGTPAFVIGQQLIPGAAGLDAMKLAVALARKSQSK
jgi:protein-disulfide isomerase